MCHFRQAVQSSKLTYHDTSTSWRCPRPADRYWNSGALHAFQLSSEAHANIMLWADVSTLNFVSMNCSKSRYFTSEIEFWISGGMLMWFLNIILVGCWQANEILHHKANLNGYLAYHTGQPYEKIVQDTDRDFFMSAKEAKDYGLIDAVISNPLKALRPLPPAGGVPELSPAWITQ